jgi:glycosyltransferase involved in cell wall biosynthesis
MAIGISVVIPTLNRLKDITDCIAALEKQTLGRDRFEVIVVDGGSTDGTVRFLEERAAANLIGLRYYTEKKKGAGAARNLGVMNSKAEFIAFTDDDCIPEPSWLSSLLNAFPSDEKCAGVGGPVISLYKKNIINRYCEYCRICRMPIFDGKVFHIPTMNVLYRRSVLLAVGIFDEKVIITEDVHLSQKIVKKGYHLKTIENGIVYHKDPKDLATLYHKAWLQGTGVATIAGMNGLRLKEDNLSFIESLIFPKSIEKFVKAEKRALYETLAFGFLHRVWRIGTHNGYCYGMKKSHL